MERSAHCKAKLERMNRALRHEEGDRVPVSDTFWSSFLKRWRDEMGLPADADIYDYYDLDWIPTAPNMDPHIKPFEILQEDEGQVVVRTGFEAVLQKKFDLPMPAYVDFDTDTIAKMAAFQFDDLGYEGKRVELAEKLRAGDEDGLVDLVSDELLDQFALVARWDDMADRLVARYKGVASRVVMYFARQSIEADPKNLAKWGEIARAVRAA